MVSARSQCAFTSLIALGLATSCASSSPSKGTTGATGSSTGAGAGSGSIAGTGVNAGTGSQGAGAGNAASGAGASGAGTGAVVGSGTTSGAATTGNAGGTGASTGTGGAATGTGGGTGVSSGTGGTGSGGGGSGMSVPGSYKTVAVVESSKAAGTGGMPEHCATLPALTPKAAGAGTGTIITVDPTKPRQTITGFGGALTEVVASTISILTPAQQTEIYNALFSSTTGNGYTMTRTHIGSSDFALSAYTFDDNGGKPDPTLANFSIAQDMDYLIPSLKAASTASGGALKVLGSKWTSPPWMKDQLIYNGGAVQAQYYGALAKYMSKYVQAYKAAGVNIWAITPANEPLGVGGSRESEVWTQAGMNTFLKTNLGPQFQTDGVATKIFIYDHNKGVLPNTAEVLWATQMFGDAVTSPFLQGVALHWYNATTEVYEATLDKLHMIAPTKDLLFDEGTADGFIFGGQENNQKTISASAQIAAAWQNDGWFWNVDQYDWGWNFTNTIADHAEYAPVTRYARDIIVGLNHWYTGWIDWCAVLNRYGAQDAAGGGKGTAGPTTYSNTRGQPGVSHIENGLPASIMVDEDPAGGMNQTGTIYYTPIYYVMRHVAKYIQPGATILTTTLSTMPNGDNTTPAQNPAQSFFATAGRNPDGTTAVVLFNSAMAAVNYSVVVGTQQVSGSIPAQGMQTLVWQ